MLEPWYWFKRFIWWRIIMEKLVELLNRFEKEKIIGEWWSVDEDDNYFWRSIENWKIVNRDYDPDAHLFMNEYIISKKFEFIKWLFDKDKIDWSKFHKYSFYKKDNKFIQYYDCESLSMALSISDTPIEDLISYLK